MKDDRLISLNAAIDTLRDRYYKYDRFAKIEELVWAIEALTSAQPEPIRLRLDHELSKEEYERLKKDCAEQPIILLPKESAQPGEDIRAMCGECDAWNQYKNYPQPGWIPCSRELPKKDGQYIVTVKYEHVDGYEDIYSEHGEWVDGHWDAGFGYYHCGRVEKVLAWQPMPIPYREGGKETDGEA